MDIPQDNVVTLEEVIVGWLHEKICQANVAADKMLATDGNKDDCWVANQLQHFRKLKIAYKTLMNQIPKKWRDIAIANDRLLKLASATVIEVLLECNICQSCRQSLTCSVQEQQQSPSSISEVEAKQFHLGNFSQGSLEKVCKSRMTQSQDSKE